MTKRKVGVVCPSKNLSANNTHAKLISEQTANNRGDEQEILARVEQEKEEAPNKRKGEAADE